MTGLAEEVKTTRQLLRMHLGVEVVAFVMFGSIFASWVLVDGPASTGIQIILFFAVTFIATWLLRWGTKRKLNERINNLAEDLDVVEEGFLDALVIFQKPMTSDNLRFLLTWRNELTARWPRIFLVTENTDPKISAIIDLVWRKGLSLTDDERRIICADIQFLLNYVNVASSEVNRGMWKASVL